MGKKSKLLAGIVMATGLLDLYMTNRVYIKKKGIVLRDMALASIDALRRGENPDGASGDEGEIPIAYGTKKETAPAKEAESADSAPDIEEAGAEDDGADGDPQESPAEEGTGADPEETGGPAHNSYLGKRRNDDTWFSAGRGNLKWYNKRRR